MRNASPPVEVGRKLLNNAPIKYGAISCRSVYDECPWQKKAHHLIAPIIKIRTCNRIATMIHHHLIDKKISMTLGHSIWIEISHKNRMVKKILNEVYIIVGNNRVIN